MALCFLYRLVRRVLELVRIDQMDDAAKDAEILVLRHQLAVLLYLPEISSVWGATSGTRL